MAKHAPTGSEHTAQFPVCSLECCGMPDHGLCPDPHTHHAPRNWPKGSCPICKADTGLEPSYDMQTVWVEYDDDGGMD